MKLKLTAAGGTTLREDALGHVPHDCCLGLQLGLSFVHDARYV